MGRRAVRVNALVDDRSKSSITHADLTGNWLHADFTNRGAQSFKVFIGIMVL